MKNNILIFAIAITTNTLFAQNEHLKPKQFPKETATRDQVQKWIDSTMLYNDSMQDVWKKQNAEAEKQQKQAIDVEKNKEIEEINKKYRAENAKKNYEEGMAELTKNIEEADFIFQGMITDEQKYEPGSNPNIEPKYNIINGYAHVLCDVVVFEIFRKNPNYTIGLNKNFSFKLNNKSISSLGIYIFVVKKGEIKSVLFQYDNSYFANFKNNFPSSNQAYEGNSGSFRKIFSTLDSSNNYFSNFKNLDLKNEYLINYNVTWSDIENDCKNNKFSFKDYLTDLRKKTEFKKKNQSGLRKARIEATTNTTFGITDFYPKTVRAGLGERLTIIGFGFGNTFNPNINIRFKNADFGGFSYTQIPNNGYMRNLDLVDFDQSAWTNTRIVVTIPSFVTQANGLSANNNTPGSGYFELVSVSGFLDLSSVTSPLPLTVEYSILNFSPNTIVGKTRQYLAQYNTLQCSNVIHWFMVDATIKSNSTILGTVEKVLKDWSDILKIDLRLSKNANSEVNTFTGATVPNTFSMIYMTNLSSTTGNLMETVNYKSNACGSNFYITYPDIAINNQANWHYPATGNKPQGTYDFYVALLHEVGHTLGLGHVIDDINKEKELMYYAGSTDFATASDRASITSGMAKGLLAAQRQINDSRNLNWSSICFGPTAPIQFAHPRDTIGCVGAGTAKFKITIATIPGMAFKWQRFIQTNTPPGWVDRNDTPGFWAGTTTPELTIIAPSTTLDNTRLRCVITMPGGCVYYSNPATLQLYNSQTVLGVSMTLNTKTACTATFNATVACADKVGYQLFKYSNGTTTYQDNTISWKNPYVVSTQGWPFGYVLYFRLIYISNNVTTLGANFAMGAGWYYKPTVTVSSSIQQMGNCKAITTLSANSNANNYQWVYPNSTFFGINAGRNVPENLGGKLPYFSFLSGSLTQYNKTPWQVESTNSCYTSVENVIAPNWCEICTTIPSTLCSNNARLASDELLAPNIPTTKTLLYPNPTDRIIHIQSNEIIQKISLYDILGTELQSLTTNDKTYQLDMQNISQGFYFVKIFTQNQKSETFKVQIMK